MRSLFLSSVLAVACVGGVVGCESSTPNSQANQVDLNARAKSSLQQMTAQDSRLQTLLDGSVGYAIFPDVGNGAVGIGGAAGRGVVYQNGKPVGTVKMDQVSVGPQVGGETYAELIIFENQQALNRLMNNSLEFDAQASAQIVKAGAAAAGRFDHGVQIYILPQGGLMAGASIAGQKFHYWANNADVNQGS